MVNKKHNLAFYPFVSSHILLVYWIKFKIASNEFKMEITKGFYDLNVPYQENETELSAILTELYEGIWKYFGCTFIWLILHQDFWNSILKK